MDQLITPDWINAATQAGAAVLVSLVFYLIARLIVPSLNSTMGTVAKAFEAGSAAQVATINTLRDYAEGQRHYFESKLKTVENELREELDSLKAENARLRREIDTVRVEDIRLKERVDRLTSDGLAKDQKIKQLREDNTRLKARVDELESKNPKKRNAPKAKSSTADSGL